VGYYLSGSFDTQGLVRDGDIVWNIRPSVAQEVLQGPGVQKKISIQTVFFSFVAKLFYLLSELRVYSNIFTWTSLHVSFLLGTPPLLGEGKWPNVKHSRLQTEQARFKPWPESLCNVKQDTLLLQCLSPPKCTNWYRQIQCRGAIAMEWHANQEGVEILLVA